MNVEIGAEAALFPEKEYISGIFVTVYWMGKCVLHNFSHTWKHKPDEERTKPHISIKEHSLSTGHVAVLSVVPGCYIGGVTVCSYIKQEEGNKTLDAFKNRIRSFNSTMCS